MRVNITLQFITINGVSRHFINVRQDRTEIEKIENRVKFFFFSFFIFRFSFLFQFNLNSFFNH